MTYVVWLRVNVKPHNLCKTAAKLKGPIKIGGVRTAGSQTVDSQKAGEWFARSTIVDVRTVDSQTGGPTPKGPN